MSLQGVGGAIFRIRRESTAKTAGEFILKALWALWLAKDSRENRVGNDQPLVIFTLDG